MRSEYRDRLDAWLPAILLFTGSAVFLGAGRLHPLINDSLGAIGTTRFYHSFASEMLHTPHWQAMHLEFCWVRYFGLSGWPAWSQDSQWSRELSGLSPALHS